MEYSIQNNLFTYATSELSQDAILAWTINNINGSDELLKKLGLQLLSKMIGQPIEIERIKVFRQILNIDLLAEFEFDGKQQILIIEDKTGTSEHDNQIQKYIDLIKNECQEPNTGIEKTNAYGEKLPLLKVNKNCVIRVAFVKTHIITDFDELRIRDIQIQNKDVIIQKISLEKLLEIYSEPLFMKHILVQMFTEHLKKIHNLQDETKFKKAFIDWRPENGKNSYLLTTYYGQWLLMKELLPFEETNDHTIILPDTKELFYKNYTYQGSSSGAPWTQSCFWEIPVNEHSKYEVYPRIRALFWRMDTYRISLNYYLDHPKKPETDAKSKEIFKKCMEILEKIKKEIDKDYPDVIRIGNNKEIKPGQKETSMITIYFENKTRLKKKAVPSMMTLKRIVHCIHSEFVEEFNNQCALNCSPALKLK